MILFHICLVRHKMTTKASKVEILSEDITVAIIESYQQRNGPTTEARLTTVVQAACEAATVRAWE